LAILGVENVPVVSFDAYVTMLFNPTTTYIELLQGFNMFACIFVVAQRTAQNQLSTSSEDRSKPAQRTTRNQLRGPLKTSSEDRSKPARFDGERETEIERERERDREGETKASWLW